MRIVPLSSVRWLVLLGATAASWLPLVWLEALLSVQPPGRLDRAEFTAVTGESIPPDASGWHAVTLPDDWRARRPGVREGWYRLRFRAPAAGESRWAVYLPTVTMNAVAYLNGERIGDGGRFDGPMGRNANRPLLFAMPAGAQQPGENILHLRVEADLLDAGLLPAVYAAPLEDLAPVYHRAAFIRQTLLWALIVFRLVVAAFTAAIWAMWRREAYYGWFSLCAVAWVVAELNLTAIPNPVSTAAWYWLFNVAIGWWGIFGARLVLSFVGVSRPRAEGMLMAFGIAGSLVLGILAAAGSPWFYPVGVNLWLVASFALSCYLFRGVVPLLRQHPDAVELNIVFVVALSVFGCVLFDLVMQLGLRPRGGLSAPSYSSLVAIAGMGWVLVRRFVGALAESQALALTLEQRVRDEHADLEASYARIRGIERARVLSEERERVLRDTDEGLGSQLVSTLAMLERPETSAERLQESVRAALDDLRLVIDSLDPVEGDLLPALAMLRTHWQPRLDAASVGVDWRVEEIPPLALSPHRVLQILRILQRAFAGTLARGRGGTLTIRTGTLLGADGARSTLVEIGDDAVAIGIDDGMRARAEEIGATLTTVRSETGLILLRLALPVAPGVESRVCGIAGDGPAG